MPIPDGTPPALATLLTACLDADPARRPDFAAVLAQVQALRASMGPRSPSVDAGSGARLPPQHLGAVQADAIAAHEARLRAMMRAQPGGPAGPALHTSAPATPTPAPAPAAAAAVSRSVAVGHAVSASPFASPLTSPPNTSPPNSHSPPRSVALAPGGSLPSPFASLDVQKISSGRSTAFGRPADSQ